MANDPTESHLYPGQIERLIFTLDHVRALASPVRALVFWCFSATEPKSVTDIATEIGKSAQTVRYHVNELIDLELIVKVDERRRRSRTEHLYVRKGLTSFDSGAVGSAEYNRYRARGVALEARKMTREVESYFPILEQDPAVVTFSAIRKAHLRITVEQGKQLQRDITAMFRKVVENQVSQEDPEGVQVNFVLFLSPTVYQSRLWAEERGIELGESIESDDESEA